MRPGINNPAFDKIIRHKINVQIMCNRLSRSSLSMANRSEIIL
jgi:hypothetical protein